MSFDPLADHPSETRQLSSRSPRVASGAGPPWWVVLAVVALGLAASAYALLR
ncbi:MAG: hypothetical protein R3B06_10500 [Kofleriaceae bacterium]